MPFRGKLQGKMFVTVKRIISGPSIWEDVYHATIFHTHWSPTASRLNVSARTTSIGTRRFRHVSWRPKREGLVSLAKHRGFIKGGRTSLS